MSKPLTASYGSWKSPISSKLITASVVALDQIFLDGQSVYWVENRPTEAGRSVIVQRSPDGRISERILPPFGARSLVHEYGGGSYIVDEGTLYFCNLEDQGLYRQVEKGSPEPLTAGRDLRYADATRDGFRERLIAVQEDHTGADCEASNCLVGIPVCGGARSEILVSGNDFYSNPRLSPDGSCLAWLTWDHPRMPWDGTELWLAKVRSDGSLEHRKRVAGGVGESIFQPEWSPEGVLHFVSDRTGWWNLYRYQDGRAEPLCEKAAEFGRPQWVFGMSTYGFTSENHLVCALIDQGTSKLGLLESKTGKLEPIDFPYTEIRSLKVSGQLVTLLAGSPRESTAIVQLNLESGNLAVLRRSSDITVGERYLSVPEPIEFPTESAVTAHGFFYRPRNGDFSAPSGTLPPLLVKCHGGPTSAASTALSLEVQYWCSRGFAILDVNYGGSSGYGRNYRERLRGQWGVVDVADCVNGARYLAEQGWVDTQRMAIRGGSAGGYTTLAALTFQDVFTAGASYYGISDLESLAEETHKFESRYLEGLIGPYPEEREIYWNRSPIHFTDRLSCPVILFQGLNDKVVPPNQAERMLDALRNKGLPVAYFPFEEEQHGFRRAENIKRALDAECYFYSKIFGFELAEAVEPVFIENLQCPDLGR